MASNQPENNRTSPLNKTTQLPPLPEKQLSPDPQPSVLNFFVGDPVEEIYFNRSTAINAEVSPEITEIKPLEPLPLPLRRSSTCEGLVSNTLKISFIEPSSSVASLDSSHDSNGGTTGETPRAGGSGSNGNGEIPLAGGAGTNSETPRAGGAVKSNSNVSGNQSTTTAVDPMVEEAWDRLRKSYVFYKGQPVGTVAASDTSAEALNYNQVFVRDFFPSALACLMKEPPEADIVKNFLLKTLHLQGREKKIDNFTLGEGVMPASFKVKKTETRKHVQETLEADYGGSAIGRVAPMDSGFWWIILLKSYVKSTRDYAMVDMPDVQRGIKLILNLCLSDGFDTFPSLLCADACCMIDRRMGIYGYPIEIQALFFYALRCAKQMLKEGADNKELLDKIVQKIKALSFHIRSYYWLDHTQLNNIYRYRTEEYSHTAVNKFNVSPDSIPDWLFEFMPIKGGYFIGNVSPARMDFRWFLLGNCIAILSSLATPEQASAIMDLIDARWEELIGEMPLKISYPALEGYEWSIVTGYDPKNTRWSYHNGGSWPVLLWLLIAACIKTGRPVMAKRAMNKVEERLAKDGWPEYYDGKSGLYVGKQARKYQTWSIAGYLVAKKVYENPANLMLVSLEEDKTISKPKLTRSASWSAH